MSSIRLIGLLLSIFVFALPQHAQVTVDTELPIYRRVDGISGSIKSVGSDSMNNLMTLWSEGFRDVYPGVRIEIEGKGSSTAPPALIEGTANFGPMSREMKDKEIDLFVKKYGYKPTSLAVAIDLLAVYVHKDNPVAGMTLAELDAIYSKFRRRGHPSDILDWGGVGLTDYWANKPVRLYGRNAASGTYGFLKERVLTGGDFKDRVQEQPGSSSVVLGVANDLYGIGYSGIGYKTADVRAVPLASRPGQKLIPADPRYAYTGEYPLARSLWLVVNYDPKTPLDPLRREFVCYVLSQQGQRDVIKDGYIPVTAAMARETKKALGIKDAPAGTFTSASDGKSIGLK